MRILGYIFLVVGLIGFGGTLSKAPLGASGIYLFGYFLPTGLITLIGLVLLVFASKRDRSK